MNIDSCSICFCNTLPSIGFAGSIFSVKVGGTINAIDCSYRKSNGLKDN